MRAGTLCYYGASSGHGIWEVLSVPIGLRMTVPLQAALQLGEAPGPNRLGRCDERGLGRGGSSRDQDSSLGF